MLPGNLPYRSSHLRGFHSRYRFGVRSQKCWRKHRPDLLAGNVAAVFLILLGNVMHWEPTDRINKNQVCNDGTDVSVKAWDYSPFYYMIMVGAVAIAVGFIFLVNPSFKRLDIDSKESLESKE